MTNGENEKYFKMLSAEFFTSILSINAKYFNLISNLIEHLSPLT